MGLGLDGSHVHAEAAEQRRALFFDLKLVLGPDLSCLCHKCISLMSCHVLGCSNCVAHQEAGKTTSCEQSMLACNCSLVSVVRTLVLHHQTA